LLNRKRIQDNYFTRKEWIIRIINSYNINDEFNNFSRELYNLIRLKNEIKSYLMLKTLKFNGLAEKIIENELDYCVVNLNNILTNNHIVRLRKTQQQKEREIVKHKIMILRQKKKESNHGLV